MQFFYLIALAIALTGMVMLDRRFRLFFWNDARRAALVLAIGVAFFLAWDLAGISLGIFFRGQTPYMTGLLIAPELPVEELFFLILLSYLTMNLYAVFSYAGTGEDAPTQNAADPSPAGKPSGNGESSA